jgi:hypothetical protein
MKPGDLRQFVDNMFALSPTDNTERSTFIVLKVTPFKSGRAVDILLNGRLEVGLGYRWVEDNSEPLNETV